LVVSLEAIFLSIVLLISQNRLTRLADRRAHLDLQINLLAEQESTRTIALLHRIAAGLGITIDDLAEDRDLVRRTDVRQIMDALDRELPSE
jgi:uncharacterized membrane protein